MNKETAWLYIRRTISVILLLAATAVIYFGLDYLLTDDVDSKTRVTFHDFYEAETVDYVFVGSSHTETGIDAVGMGEKLGKTVFSLGTSAQDFPESYFVLKDALNQKDIKNVYVEISPSRFKISKPSETATYIISDYIRSPLVKAEMLITSFGTDKYINSFFRLRRNLSPTDLPSASDIVDLHNRKKEEAYLNYLGTNKYLGNGSWYLGSTKAYQNTIASNVNSSAIDVYTVDQINEREWEYFEKIVDLCARKGVNATFFVMPYCEYYFIRFADYQKVIDKCHAMVSEHGFDFIDMNLAKEDALVLEYSDFCNLDHVNLSGNRIVSDFLVRYIETGDKSVFYDKLTDRYPVHDRVVNVGYDRLYITEKGEYKKASSAEGKIESMKLDISAIGYRDIPVDTAVYEVEMVDGTPVEGKRIDGTVLDELHTRYILPYRTSEQRYYKVILQDPVSGEKLYETITDFSMD